MKTLEEKARRYDEALKVLHKYDGANIMFTQDLKEEMFPELKESEDERIRKELIAEVKEQIDCIPAPDCRDKEDEKALKQLNKWLAWLEKQNTVYDKELSEILGRVICRYINDPNISYTEREKVSKEIIPYVERLEKQNDKKPADKTEPKFKVGDVIRRKDGDGLEWTVEDLHEDGNYTIFNSDRDDLVYLDDNWELVEQNTAWSEEDEEMYKKIETAINSYYAPFSRDAEEMSDWFKSLKDRVQPKQEWSEEDEKILNLIIARLHSHPSVEVEEYGKDYHWFKSIKDRYTWKPSDKELGALLVAIGDERQESSDVAKELLKIYHHLKKLKG